MCLRYCFKKSTFPERNDGSFHFSIVSCTTFLSVYGIMSKISRRRRDPDPQGRQTCWASPRRRCPSCLRVQRYGNFSVPPNLSPTFFTFSCFFLHFAVKGRLFRPKKGWRKGKAAGAGKGYGGGGTGGEGRGLRHSPTLLYIYAREGTGR